MFGFSSFISTPPKIVTISVPNPHLDDNIDIILGKEPSDGLVSVISVMCVISMEAGTQEPQRAI